MRVRIHPASDAYMMGVRYGDAIRATRNQVTVRGFAGTVKVSPLDIMPLEDGGTLEWLIVAPREGAVDETFSDTYADALTHAYSIHGDAVWLVLKTDY